MFRCPNVLCIYVHPEVDTGGMGHTCSWHTYDNNVVNESSIWMFLCAVLWYLYVDYSRTILYNVRGIFIQGRIVEPGALCLCNPGAVDLKLD